MDAVAIGGPNRLTFAWWNLNSFAHYDPARISLKRWPKQRWHYETKRDRILDLIPRFSPEGCPDLFVVCEITREAAADLVSRLPQDFDVVIAPAHPHEDDFQVAIFYRMGFGLTRELPLLPSESEDVTRETRPMVAVHLTFAGHIIRFVACHWTGLDEPSSRAARVRLADFLSPRHL
ncbi:hypothetical protein ACYOEI_21130 [Singulisphaera rosea]